MWRGERGQKLAEYMTVAQGQLYIISLYQEQLWLQIAHYVDIDIRCLHNLVSFTVD